MEAQFYTIHIDGYLKNPVRYDLPKVMPVPQIGSKLFIKDVVAEVIDIYYHVNDEGKLHWVDIQAKRTS